MGSGRNMSKSAEEAKKNKADREYRRRKLKIGAGLKRGDLVFTCLGLNGKIRSITPETVTNNPRGPEYPPVEPWVVDYDIVCTNGGSHSWMHCCGKVRPLKQILLGALKYGEDTEQVQKYFKNWPDLAYLREIAKLAADEKTRKTVIRDDGCPTKKYFEIRYGKHD